MLKVATHCRNNMMQRQEFGRKAFIVERILAEEPECRGCYTLVEANSTLSLYFKAVSLSGHLKSEFTNCLNHSGNKLVLLDCLEGRARCCTGFAV